MTYNVLGGANVSPGAQAVRDQGFGSELPLKVRMPVAAKKIEVLRPDLIGIQENEGPGKLPIAYLGAAEPAFTVLFEDDADPILFRTDRFAVVDSGLAAPNTEPACRASITARPHCITWVRLTDLPSGRDLMVVNTHAPAGDAPTIARARAENVEAISRLLSRENANQASVLVLGDFNASSNETRSVYDAHLTAMRDRGLVDAAHIALRDDSDVPRASSANWFAAEIDGKTYAKAIRREGFHLDYIWVPQTARVLSWQTLSGPDIGSSNIAGEKVPFWTGAMASDHSPVAALVVFP